ncbi:stAR-related lipid transfer protein 7, mitochondrial [Pteropus medius]|uniref:stAR-related lipid transfer protein 7, mitochondrial n=1 Tax=Pteropus vampyrus TaxID=132908 RepID=UPI00196A8E82|nr:stAR-related lipid transfer protein 7, mitochondrial [Pteropus giganteus]XP_039728498.1 stAR-related lipid transfer protein 7, mitochondrial [Pteropus giganteus]
MFQRRLAGAVAAAAARAGLRGGGLLALLANQCRFVTGLRVRRAQQIAQLYGRLYSDSARRVLLGRLWRRLRGRAGHASGVMAALAGVFVWDEERIQEEELQRSIDEMKRLEEMSTVFQSSGVERHPPEPKSQTEGNEDSGGKEQPWEMVMDKKHFKLWRRPIAGTHLYQYRVFGTYTDVTPRQFFNVQLDTEYRKKWDALVIKLEVIERDVVSGSEVLHWVTHFPYPMYSRDYVYVRRYSVDQENNVMVLVSRAVEHPSVPESPEFVRVRSYESQMVIRPHKSFDENGFDYLLTYSDNPQTVFPRYCVSWMVSSGMPDFLEKLHMATLKAKNMEIKVKDYISSKPLEMGSEAKATSPSPERKGEGSRSPPRIEYA